MVATSSFVLAASSILPLALGAPLLRKTASSVSSPVERRAAFSGYTVYGGDGSTGAGWPAESAWQSFDNLWTANMKILTASCSEYTGSPQDNSDAEIADIKSAIESVSSSTSLPKEFLLAIMMQESKGCVRVPTTSYSVQNPGLFQDFNGDASCNNGGSFTTPCPADTITKMVQQGAGIGLDFGLTQAVTQAAGSTSDASTYYKAARIYNSGSLPSGGNLGGGVATHCYASDIANRLMGWTDETTGCSEGTIGSLTASAGSTGNGNGNDDTSPPPPATPTTPAAPASTPSATPAPAKPSTVAAPTTPTTGDNKPTAQTAPGVDPNCKSYYTVKEGDNCGSTGISFDTLRQLNTDLDANCSNLWLGYAYCIAA